MNKLKLLRVVKKSFHLLEVLISMLLLIVCAIPALQLFTSLNETQTAFRRVIQKDHMAHLIHARLIEKFYNVGSFADAINNKRGDIDFEDLKAELSQLHLKPYFELKIIYPEKEEKEPKLKNLAELTIHLMDHSKQAVNDPQQSHTTYSYAVFFERDQIKDTNNENNTK